MVVGIRAAELAGILLLDRSDRFTLRVVPSILRVLLFPVILTLVRCILWVRTAASVLRTARISACAEEVRIVTIEDITGADITRTGTTILICGITGMTDWMTRRVIRMGIRRRMFMQMLRRKCRIAKTAGCSATYRI